MRCKSFSTTTRWCLRMFWRRCTFVLLGILFWQTIIFLSSLHFTTFSPNHELVRPPRELLSSSDVNVSNGGGGGPPADVVGDPWVDTWRAMEPNNKDPIWAYAAYYDTRISPTVVVMAIFRTKNPQELVCQVVAADGSRSVVPAVKKLTKENWKLLYSAFRVLCPLTGAPNDDAPVQVAIYSAQSKDKPSTFLRVHDRRREQAQWSAPFAVCVKPMHYEYDRAVWLVEFIEFYRLLGVGRFYFYNHTVGPKVQAVLQHYIVQGLVTTLPWDLPVRSQLEIRTEGMFAALDDCLYRTAFRHNYTLIVDFDEYLIPREDASYRELMPKLHAKKPSAAAFVFQNVFFYLYWENDTQFETQLGLEHPDVPYLITLFKTRRLSEPHRYGTRSKYIVMPEFAIDVGNHNVWEMLPGKTSYNVPSSIGLSQHYRICEYGGFDCLRKPSVIDRSAWRFAADLYRRVQITCARTFPVQGKCPAAPPLGSPW